MTDSADRLRAEAAFQDERALSAEPEPRDKYYFLANRAMAHYRAALGDVGGKRALVVGCAEGGVTPLARRGATVVGIDVSPEAIRKLRSAIVKEGLAGRAEAHVMDAERVAFPADSFDLICCTGVLHHLDVEPAIASWVRTLRRDGSIVMLEPMAWNPVVALYRIATPSSRTADEHPMKPADIRILRKHFGRVDVRGFVLSSALAAGWAFFPRARLLKERSVTALEWLDDRMLSAIPALAYGCWTSVIRCAEPLDR